MIGISAHGGYVPRMRMPREVIAKANAWLNPGLRGHAKGERALGSWDEDPVTMAVEAARDCLAGHAGARVDALYLASTTLPFADRLNAGIVAGALDLPESLSAVDVGSTQRAGLSALNAAFDAVRAGRCGAALVLAAERSKGAPGSVAEIARGDAAAAVVVSDRQVLAEYLGGATHTIDFVSHYRGAGADFSYEWEERWVRDEGYAKLVPPVLERALEAAGVAADEVSHFIFPVPVVAVQVARGLGIAPERIADSLQAQCGDTGTAHPLLLLSHVLERARPGEIILVAAFGHGVDALVFRVTGAILESRPQRGVSGYLAQRIEERQYMKLPIFNRLMPYDKGMRAEFDRKATMSLMYRKRDLLEAFVGGKCTSCGTAQIPRARACVKCAAFDTQVPHRFADEPGKVVSWSADYLAYSVNPPHHFGMVEFAAGGRLIVDITDVGAGEIDTGSAVRMVFRIKDFDDSRSFRRYFWKAMPALTA